MKKMLIAAAMIGTMLACDASAFDTSSTFTELQEARTSCMQSSGIENLYQCMQEYTGENEELISEEETEQSITAFYGDKLEDRVVIIDVDNMTLKSEVYTEGLDPYPVDRAGTLDKVYAITRGSSSIDVIDSNTFEKLGLIELQHFPRSSEAYNDTLGLQLVTGADKPMASLIDVNTDTVVATVGLNEEFSVEDYGGSNATGHPFWFSDDKFALIDRPNRMIHVYTVTKNRNNTYTTTLFSSTPTPTAVHHFVKRSSNDHFFYALTEGSPTFGISPSVVKYKLTHRGLRQIRETPLSTDPELIPLMGSHHADMHPDGVQMYIGSTEGHLYILNTRRMQIMSTIETGIGTGHTTFVPDRNIAVVTNHKDTFLTIVDTQTNTAIKNITVSGESINGEILQSHSTFIHPNMDFFYAFATDNGIFYELNLETLEVTRTLETGGTPLQGNFICKGAECENLM